MKRPLYHIYLSVRIFILFHATIVDNAVIPCYLLTMKICELMGLGYFSPRLNDQQFVLFSRDSSRIFYVFTAKSGKKAGLVCRRLRPLSQWICHFSRYLLSFSHVLANELRKLVNFHGLRNISILLTKVGILAYYILTPFQISR